jgi:osmoprotectant transport system ATP-binding protein
VKLYPGQDVPAVDKLNLHIPAGEIVMFVGPSGCGKTTSLKMINRLIEPTSGTITIGGEDVKGRSVDELRRHIGYVIQGGSLFPHMTVAQNIAMVPKLLKWDSQRVDARVDELLDLVSLDATKYRDRYPRELSGGQQQRVGVARGLAADPPVVLMDEPFGAVDPITRQRLQDELMSIQAELRKTIVCVTHDIDEAIKLGDRICILREGAEIAQYDTPENILANPANRFVEDFVGAGSSLKQLTLMRVSDIDLLEWPTATVGEDSAAAVRRAKEAGERSVIILDDNRRPRDWVWLRDLEDSSTVARPSGDDVLGVDRRATLNDALDDMLTSSHGGAIVTGRREEFLGVASFASVTRQIQSIGGESDQERLDRGTPA